MSSVVLEPDRVTADRDEAPPPRPTPMYRRVLTGVVAFGPPATAALMIARGSLSPFPWRELVLTVVFCALVGHGVTIGFHRLFAHRSFRARRPLKVVLAVLGSMSFQGSLIGWVSDHRRHHRHADRPLDPHSPVWQDETPTGGWRGLWHAHLGWCFGGTPTSRAEYAPDLLADRDLVVVDRMFLPCCVLTLALPFGIGYLWRGTLGGAVAALLWAGVIRIGITHNFTWSVNSFCHRFGRRTFETRDQSTNIRVLAPFTMGESWHNNHHAFPTLARHGVDRGQPDSSAWLIRLFERLGWVSDVRWPDRLQLELRRVPSNR
jgi:stearoyl-CoA desaturase (Delta-9 desaturase)